MRIFVFRPRSDAERSARKLAARGHEAVVAPLFDVKPSQEPAPDGAFDAIVLTSGNAVPALASAPDAWRRLPVFTVGARTAARVREAGLPDARSADGGRDELIALIGDNLGPPARLLLIVGRDRHDDVGARLAAAGFSTTIWTAYAAEAVEVLPETAAAALRDRNVEAALHYSPRAAQVFLDLVQGAGLREPALELTHVALSAEVAAPLVAAGASTILVAEHPEEAALMAALDQVLARKTGADDAREGAVAPVGGDAGEDAMKAPKTSGSETNAGDPSGADATAPARGRARRTPPTIEGKGFERKAFERKAVEGEAVEGKASAGGVISGEAPASAGSPPPVPDSIMTEVAAASPDVAETAAEAILPTKALPQEFAAPPGAAARPAAEDAPRRDGGRAGTVAPPPAPARSSLPGMLLAGLIGGVVGAGLVMLALSLARPDDALRQIAALRTELDAVRAAAAAAPDSAALAAIDAKAVAAAAAAVEAGRRGAEANAAVGALAARAAAQPLAGAAGAITDLTGQAQRAQTEAAAARTAADALGQRLDQATARIGSVETLARSAASPSPQALAAARIVLAERVQNAIASGQPFAGDVAALAKGGGAAEQLAALEAVAATGAPTRAALLAQMKSHRAMLERALLPADAGWQDRLAGLASRIVTIRPVGESADANPGTLVVRLESAIAAGRNGDAAGLWGQLPEPARRASAAFGEALRKRAAADAAIAKIAQDAVAALGAAG